MRIRYRASQPVELGHHQSATSSACRHRQTKPGTGAIRTGQPAIPPRTSQLSTLSASRRALTDGHDVVTGRSDRTADMQLAERTARLEAQRNALSARPGSVDQSFGLGPFSRTTATISWVDSDGSSSRMMAAVCRMRGVRGWVSAGVMAMRRVSNGDIGYRRRHPSRSSYPDTHNLETAAERT